MAPTPQSLLSAAPRPRLFARALILAGLLIALSIGAKAQQLDADTVGQVGGPYTAIATRDHYAYIGQGSAFKVLDVANPARPVELGSVALPGKFLRQRGVTLDGPMAYTLPITSYNTVTSKTLTLVDISDPATPRRRGSIDFNYRDQSSLAASGGLACMLGNYGQSLNIYNVSDPDHPALVRQFPLATHAGDLAMKGSLVYLLYYNKLDIIDLQDPAQPVPRGHLSLPRTNNGSGWQMIRLDGQTAYLIGDELAVVSLSDPDAPLMMGSVVINNYTKYDAALMDATTIITVDGVGMRFIDISDPAHPADKGSYNPAGGVYAVSANHHSAYALYSPTLQPIDLSDLAAPRPLAPYGGPDLSNITDATTSGTMTFLITRNRLLKMDISQPSHPAFRGISDACPGDPSFNRIELIDNHLALVSSAPKGVQLYNIDGETSPTWVGGYYMWGTTYHAVAAGRQIVYAANNYLGVPVLDISRPTSPTMLRRFATGGNVRDVAVGGGLVCVADTDKGLLTYDISDPTSPVMKSVSLTWSKPTLVTMVGRTACVAHGDSRISIIDLTDPTSPRFVGGNPTDSRGNQISINATALDIHEGILFVRATTRQYYYNPATRAICLIDIRNPRKPVYQGVFYSPQDANFNYDNVLAGGLLYVNGPWGGLLLQRIIPPVQLMSPNGGERVAGGSPLPIHWRNGLKSGGTGVRLELWNTQGQVAVLGEDWNTSGENAKTFRLPLLPEAGDYRIRAVSLWNEDFTDDSDAPFTITGGAVRLTEPAGGEAWLTGSTQFIHWQTSPLVGGPTVRLELWHDGQKVADLGTAIDPHGEARSPVTVPAVAPGGGYTVRAISVLNPALSAESAPITIRPGDGKNAVEAGSWAIYR